MEDDFLKDTSSGALPPTHVNPDDVCFGCCPLRGIDSTTVPRVSPNTRPATPYQYDRQCTDSAARRSHSPTLRARSPPPCRTRPLPTDNRSPLAAPLATPASRSRSSRPLSRTSSRPPIVLIPAPLRDPPFLAPPGLDAPPPQYRGHQDENQDRVNRPDHDWSSTGWRSSWQGRGTETPYNAQWSTPAWERNTAWTTRDRPLDRHREHPRSNDQRESNEQWRQR